MRGASVMHQPRHRDRRSRVRQARGAAEHQVGFLPVYDDARRVVGIVTDRDLTVRVCAAGGDTTRPIGEVMSQGVITCRASDPIVVVEELMVRNRKQRIVVVDDEMRPIGVVAVADLVAHERYETVARTYRRIANDA